MLNFKKFIPAVLLLLLIILGTNPLLQFGLKKAGEAAFGAKTEIAGFSLNFLTGRLRLKSLTVANKNAPFTNLFELGRLNLGVNPEQLLYKRVAIESLTVDNILLGTPRQTSGALKKKAKAKPEKKPLDFNKLAGDLQINPAAAQNALQVAPPKAGAEAARIQKENDQILAAARKQIETFDLNKEIAALGLDELGSLNLASAADLQKAQSLLKEKQQALNKITSALQDNQSAAEKALQEAQKNLAYLDTVRQQDIANLLASLDFGNYDLGALGKELLGPKINGWLDAGAQYLALAQKYMPPKKAAKPQKQRLRGVTVVFPNRKTLPRFWIGRAGISGRGGQGANELAYSGYISDIASEQHIIGRPTVVDIQGGFVQRAGSLLKIKAVFDRRETAKDSIDFALSGYDLNGAQFWDEQTIPLKITGGLGRIEAKIELAEDALSGKISLLGQNLKYAPLDSPAGLNRLAAEAIQAAPELRIDIVLGGSLSAPDIRLTSNLDSLLKARLEKELGDQVGRAKAQLTAEYEKAAGYAGQQAAASLHEYSQAFEGLQERQQAALDAEKAKLTQKQKELENQLNSEVDSAKKQAEDALKNVLPNIKF